MVKATSEEPVSARDDREYQVIYNNRIAVEHFGSQKYTTTARALGELIANSFDADANRVEITIRANELGQPSSLVVSDDGRGITLFDFERRFVEVGVVPIDRRGSFSRFGVGRFAVYRIGTVSEWASTARVADGAAQRVSFALKSPGDHRIRVHVEDVVGDTNVGTQIEVFNLRDGGKDALNPSRLAGDLISQFCSYLLGNPSKRIVLNEKELDVAELVDTESNDRVVIEDGSASANLRHLVLKRSLERSRQQEQLLYTAQGRTVLSESAEDVAGMNYLALIESKHFDEILASNREALIELDQTFEKIRSAVVRKVADFAQSYRQSKHRQFIVRARSEDFYPFNAPSTSPLSEVEQELYDVVLEKVHESVNLDSMSKKQRAVIFKLLHRSLENENLLDVVEQVASLSDEDVAKFKKVLERTTLGSLVKLASEVTNRLAFLDSLHKLVYGDVAKLIRERSQLHKLIEPNGWLFSPHYHLATSDKSFRTIVRQHRRLAGLSDVEEDTINDIRGIDDIPDLFLASTRDFPVHPKHHHLLVEIKAPKVSLGPKERDQIRKYAETVMDSPQFEKLTTKWDLYLVSAQVSAEIERDRTQKDKAHGLLWEWDNCAVWAFSWAEVIARAREEMQLVLDHLNLKSRELAVSDYLRESFPEVLGSDLLERVTSS